MDPRSPFAFNRALSRLCASRQRPDLERFLSGHDLRPALTLALRRHPELLDLVVDEQAAMTGVAAPSMDPRCMASLPRLAMAVHPRILRVLGLEDCGVVTLGAGRKGWLDSAFGAIRSRFPGARASEVCYGRLAESWISMIAWLSFSEKVGASAIFSSASFPQFTGCVFVTDLALRHVAPDSVFARPSSWCLQDNLIHEALHHHLEGLTTLGAIYRDLRRATEECPVAVPWRRESWGFVQAFQALYVYKNLIEVRRDALARLTSDDPEKPPMQRALDDALSCSDSLTRSVRHVARDYLNSHGIALLDQVLAIGKTGGGR